MSEPPAVAYPVWRNACSLTQMPYKLLRGNEVERYYRSSQSDASIGHGSSEKVSDELKTVRNCSRMLCNGGWEKCKIIKVQCKLGMCRYICVCFWRCAETGSTSHDSPKPSSPQEGLQWKVILKCIIMGNLLNPNYWRGLLYHAGSHAIILPQISRIGCTGNCSTCLVIYCWCHPKILLILRF